MEKGSRLIRPKYNLLAVVQCSFLRLKTNAVNHCGGRIMVWKWFSSAGTRSGLGSRWIKCQYNVILWKNPFLFPRGFCPTLSNRAMTIDLMLKLYGNCLNTSNWIFKNVQIKACTSIYWTCRRMNSVWEHLRTTSNWPKC